MLVVFLDEKEAAREAYDTKREWTILEKIP